MIGCEWTEGGRIGSENVRDSPRMFTTRWWHFVDVVVMTLEYAEVAGLPGCVEAVFESDAEGVGLGRAEEVAAKLAVLSSFELLPFTLCFGAH